MYGSTEYETSTVVSGLTHPLFLGEYRVPHELCQLSPLCSHLLCTKGSTCIQHVALITITTFFKYITLDRDGPLLPS